MKTFRVRVRTGSHADIESAEQCAHVVECSDADWQEYRQLRIPGFDSHYSLSIGDVWNEFHSAGGRVVGAATGYETIVKFGGTVQLEQIFTIVIEETS